MHDPEGYDRARLVEPNDSDSNITYRLTSPYLLLKVFYLELLQ